ncbi:MAG: hypothetical protein D6812_00380 [Deltaproteobacteria bacterium]|nr:MAG: hypothetical protein D6812_00380 [Deltaproteobacteria bacterium]
MENFPDVEALPQIEGFRILSRIGSGGWGDVFKARDLQLDRIVAIKTIRKEGLDNPEVWARFYREAWLLAKLDHEGIVDVHKIIREKERLYIVMAFVEGETLKERIEGGPIPYPEACRIACQILSVVAFIHEQGIVHRDIKPANIMVTPSGSIKLLDFGLARILIGSELAETTDLDATIHQITRAGSLIGTMAYIAPEMARGGQGEHDPSDARSAVASDIFSLGIVLYEIFTGRRPFQGETAWALVSEILEASPPPIREFRPEVPESVERVILKALQKDPQRRFATVGEMLAALEEAITQGQRWYAPLLSQLHAHRNAAIYLVLFLGLFLSGYWLMPSVPPAGERVTTIAGTERFPRVSRKNLLAFVAHDRGLPTVGLLDLSLPFAPIRFPFEDPGGSIEGVTWSPDGERLYLTTHDALGHPTIREWRLGDPQPPHVFLSGARDLAFSHDGKRIAFAGEVAGHFCITLSTIDANPKAPCITKRPIDRPGEDLFPDWSPDDRWIVFERRPEQEIWVVAADGSREGRLTEKGAISPQWHPKRKRVYFLRPDTPGVLWYLDFLPGQHDFPPHRMKIGQGDPIHSFSFSLDGKRLFYATQHDSSSAPPQGSIFVLPLER